MICNPSESSSTVIPALFSSSSRSRSCCRPPRVSIIAGYSRGIGGRGHRVPVAARSHLHYT
ncbi:MAG: hypothetical protein MZV70_37460 [Desulfobacterales bacterium]|nr:hypothetical protein [Desulfobacterales bacterium]